MINKKPRVAQISITNRCQCNCEHCWVTFLRDNNRIEPSIKEIIWIFRKLKSSQVKFIDLFWWEPTLRKDIFSIIKIGKAFWFNMIVETNWSLLDKEYTRKLYEAGVYLVYISIDSEIETEHDSFRWVKWIFRKAVNALWHCKEIWIEAHVSAVPKDETYFKDWSINSFIDFCLSSWAKRVRIMTPRYVWSMQLWNDTPFYNCNELSLLQYIDQKYYPFIYFDSLDTPLDKSNLCIPKDFFLHITTNWDVLPCPYLPVVCWNIYDQTLEEIWFNIQNVFYKKIIKHNFCPARDVDFVKKIQWILNKDKPYISISELG